MPAVMRCTLFPDPPTTTNIITNTNTNTYANTNTNTNTDTNTKTDMVIPEVMGCTLVPDPLTPLACCPLPSPGHPMRILYTRCHSRHKLGQKMQKGMPR